MNHDIGGDDMTIPGKIESPAAWRGSDIAKQGADWLIELTGREIAEIEAAAELFIAGPVPIGQITADAFPLPRFAERLANLRNGLMTGLGFRLIRGLPIERYSREECATIFCGIGAHIGRARSQNAQGHILGHVRDIGADVRDTGTRIYQTRERQTFHTDSSDAVGLLCLKDAMEGGESLVASSVTIFNIMRAEYPDLLGALFEPVATDRRGEVPPGEKPYFLIPVYTWHDGYLTSIYQRQYINSAQRFADAPRLSERHIEALDMHDALADDPAIHLAMRLQPGDMQFVYNHSLLHDRMGFRDWPDPANRRHLLRLWLSLPGDRPLPPSYAQRYGSITIGDRGGIIVEGTTLHAPLE